MKIERLLKRVESFLSAKERKRHKKRDEIREVLDELKKKERKLGEAARSEQDEGVREALESRRLVVHAQRKKGIAALKALKKS